MKSDRVIVYYTANRIAESFANAVRSRLLSVAGDTPVVSVSQKPIDLGLNLCVGELGCSAWLVYWQVLQGALLAREQFDPRWIVCCEDDSLYTREHLRFVPRGEDAFFYNKNRWILENSGDAPLPHFRWRDRTSMMSCVAGTDLLIDTLRRRFEKYPDPITRTYDPRLRGWGEPGRYEWYLKLPRVGLQAFATADPIVTFNHKQGLGGLRKQNIKDIIETCLPPWGSARDLWLDCHG
jgi:hypothetical protein